MNELQEFFADSLMEQHNHELKDLQTAFKDTAKLINDLETQLHNAAQQKIDITKKLIGILKNFGLSRITNSETGDTFSLVTTTFYSSPAANYNLLKQWLIDIKATDIIKETVHHQTLGSLLKEWVSQGNQLPPFCTSYTKEDIRLKSGQ